MELNVQDWKDFKLSSIMNIFNGKGLTDDEIIENTGFLPAIQGGEHNLGILGYIDEDYCKNQNYIVIEEPCLTVARVGTAGYVSYHEKCAIGDKAKALVFKDKKVSSLYRYMFMCTILNANRYKYSYGRGLVTEIYMNESLKLPTQINKDNGEYTIDKNKTYSDEGYIPDWQFMEDYIKSLHHKPITTNIKPNNTKELNINSWEEFKVSDLFTLLNGKGITKEEIEENKGSFVAVQSGEENNGVLGKIDKHYCIKMGYTLTDKMCLTVARTGSAGFVSFQSAGCVVGDSAKILLLDDTIATTNVYLFLQTILTANRFKYDYGRKVTEDKYLNDIIKLPIQREKNGNPIIDDNHTYSDKGYIPDWQFMEDYINSLPYSDRIV